MLKMLKAKDKSRSKKNINFLYLLKILIKDNESPLRFCGDALE